MLKWSEMFPNGRWLFYEGGDPDGFVEEMKRKYGFDPSEGGQNKLWTECCGFQFACPPGHLDEIYSGKYPLGS